MCALKLAPGTRSFGMNNTATELGSLDMAARCEWCVVCGPILPLRNPLSRVMGQRLDQLSVLEQCKTATTGLWSPQDD